MQRPTAATAPRQRAQLYLSSADQEIANVERESEGITWERLERPSPEAVLDAMSGTSFLHVACHGISDPRDPSASYLVFQRGGSASASAGGDGSPQVEEARLTVQRIKDDARDEQRGVGMLAFLSACSTAESRVRALLDENLSIGYAFQAAGFANVVGTLWQASEDICPVFAAYFYRMLAKHTVQAGRPLTSDWIAVAVWHATVSILITEDILEEPMLWACFVHIGP